MDRDTLITKLYDSIDMSNFDTDKDIYLLIQSMDELSLLRAIVYFNGGA